MRLSNFILKNLESILQEWEEFATTLVPVDQKTDGAMLRDHVKSMLNTIAADLACPETANNKSEKSKGHRPAKKTAAAAHGAERQQSGFSLDATMAEYRALRACVMRLWQDANINKPVSKIANEDIVRFNEAIDQAVSESITSYSVEKEQQTRMLGTILSSSPDLSGIYDIDGRFAYANKALTQLLQLQSSEIIGKNFFELDYPFAAELQDQIQHVIATKEPFHREMSHVTSSGTDVCYEYIFAPVLDQDGKVEAVASIARNITERKAVEHENWKTANFDLLTGLPNRRLFCDRLEENLKHAKRIGALMALFFIDLDHFKEANDSFGHEAGDFLLQLVADRLRSCVRETDTVARLGGDEFTIILADFTDTKHVGIVAGKILKELASPFQIFKDTVHISASIGITLALQDASTSEQLIKNADQTMYMAKNAGGNRISFFSGCP